MSTQGLFGGDDGDQRPPSPATPTRATTPTRSNPRPMQTSSSSSSYFQGQQQSMPQQTTSQQPAPQQTVPQTIFPTTMRTQLIVTMPVPDSQNAPKFDRYRVRQFLDTVKRHGDAANITENELVDYVYLYSSEDVQDTIRYMPEFDMDLTSKTWKAAKDMLIALYGAMDQTPTVTLEDLRKFCQSQTAKSSFSSKGAVDRYHQAFQKFAAPLVKEGLLTTNERNFYFVSGIPKDMKEWFFNLVPVARRSRTNPPAISDSVKYLYSKFDKNSLLYEPWRNEDDTEPQEDIRLDVDGSRKRSSSLHAGTTTDDYPVYRQPKEHSAMDDLAKQLEQLRLNQTQVMSFMSSLSGKVNLPNPNVQGDPARTQRDFNRLAAYVKRCFMCGKEEPEIKHELHPSKCDETPKLVRENLMKFNEETRRYVLPDGNPLPRIPGGYAGGMAGYLRDTKTASNTAHNSRSGSPRDKPPHMARSNAIGLMYGSEEVLKGDEFAISSLGAYDSAPALRSGRDTGVRFDPMGRREEKGKGKEFQTENPNLSRAGPSQNKKNVDIPPPSNPINRPDGWKNSLPSSDKTKDIRMKDEARKEKYHFTSDVQSATDVRKVYENIMNVSVTIPIKDVIGSSPMLQKLMADSTRTRKEYTNESRAIDYSSNAAEFYSSFHVDGRIAENLCCENPGRIPEFFQRYSSAIMTSPKLYAMATGKLTVNIKGVEVQCLIDTGSELNVMEAELAEEAQLPIDFEGTKWSMKGVHGGPEQLKGVVTDVPMKVGAHDFAHHLFVSRYNLGKNKIILGQPFMRTYGAQIDFGFEGSMNMLLYKEPCDKSRTKPTITIALTDPRDPRNASEIRRCYQNDRWAARIEEVPDSDEDF